MPRRFRRDTGGHAAIFEATLVAIAVLAAVIFVAIEAEPPTTDSASRASLSASGTDALGVLADLPPTRADAHESLLEELVTKGLRGDCGPLERKLSAYYPPGVVYGLYLENGVGGRLTVCETGDPAGEQTTTFATVQPRWSHLFVVPNVTHVNGVVELDALGAVVDADTLGFHGFLVRQCYLDEVTEVKIAFTNGHAAPFNDRNGTRYTGPVVPEHVTLDGYVSGYDVPYNTSGSWIDYEASTLDMAQAPGTYPVKHNLAMTALPGVNYTVHPSYTLSGSISAALTGMDPGNRLEPDRKNADAGDTVQLSWNYGHLTDTLTTVRLAGGDLTVYDPVGVKHEKAPVTKTAGKQNVTVEQAALWGTYVAHMRLKFEEVDASGSPTGTTYIVNQLTAFNINPPGWVETAQPTPPVYRVTLAAGFTDWR